jgi:hypothetical protein
VDTDDDIIEGAKNSCFYDILQAFKKTKRATDGSVNYAMLRNYNIATRINKE